MTILQIISAFFARSAVKALFAVDSQMTSLQKALTADDLLPKGHRDDVSKSRGAR